MQMKYREHGNQVSLRREEHPVRKFINKGAPDIFLDDGNGFFTSLTRPY